MELKKRNTDTHADIYTIGAQMKEIPNSAEISIDIFIHNTHKGVRERKI